MLLPVSRVPRWLPPALLTLAIFGAERALAQSVDGAEDRAVVARRMAENQLIQQLVDAHRSGTQTVDPAPYSALDRAAAYRVQHGVMLSLGETPGLYKTAVAPDGLGNVAPIKKSRLGTTGAVRLPSANVIGLEVEVAVKLGKSVTSEMDDAAIIDAIDHYVMGVEIVGTRYTNRDLAGPTGGLADATDLAQLAELQTIGELCLSPVGLSAMTKLAPAKLAGLVMGIWFLGTALGNKLAGSIAAEFNAKDPQALAHFFWQQALLVGGMTVLLLVLVPWVRRLTGEQATSGQSSA